MSNTELESKPLAELHALAAKAGVPRYRMLRREELIEKLAGGGSAEKPRERRESRSRRDSRRPRERKPRERAESRERAEPTYEKGPETPAEEKRRPRRRRRRFGRKRKELRLYDLATAGGPGRQTIAYAETREACTRLLRELAAELAGESNGSDPIALLVDPGPEELAEWRREAPQAEIVAAAQARHAQDAVAQAVRRAEGGESVFVLIDSLTRLGELGDPGDVADLLGATGAVTVVAALEHRS